MKLKDLLNENVLGALPSSKLMKMKWNPVTDKESVEEAAPKMRVIAQAEEVAKTITIVSRIENGMKAFNQSAHSLSLIHI